MTRQRKSATERRAEIVATALTLAAEIGLRNTTAEAIASRIGLTQPAIFRHFPRKDDIWSAVIDWLDDELRAHWQAALNRSDAESRIEAVIAGHFAFVCRFPAMPLVLLSPELRRNSATIDQGSRRLINNLHLVLTQAVEDGQRAGEFSASIRAENAAHMLLAVMQGTALRWAASGHGFSLVDEGLHLAHLALDGLRPHSSRACK